MGVLFMETSALDGSNIDNAMLALTRYTSDVMEPRNSYFRLQRTNGRRGHRNPFYWRRVEP